MAAAPQPNDQLLCTVPTAFARCCGERMVSAIITVTTDHSPPNPTPCSVRVTSNCPNECVKPERNVKNAKQPMVHCNTRTRPYRSERMPASHPPIADEISELVAIIPASLLLMPHVAISVGMRNE